MAWKVRPVSLLERDGFELQYAGAVNLIVAHLVLGWLLWVSQGVPILRSLLVCWREMDSNYWFPVAKEMNPVREPETETATN